MTLKENISEIIKELVKLQTVPAPPRLQEDGFEFPRMIRAGFNRSMIVSKKIDDIILDVATQMVGASSAPSKELVTREWYFVVRTALGQALGLIDLDAPTEVNSEKVIKQVQWALSNRASPHGRRELSYGCTLFGASIIEPFEIGPVKFESRLAWLMRKKNDGAISAAVCRRIERTWAGEKQRTRKSSVDSIREQAVLNSIGSCPFVCSVISSSLGPEMDQEKSLSAARLALSAISLLWLSPSRALEGITLLFDGSINQQKALTFVKGKSILEGSRVSHMPTGSWLADGEWEAIFANESDYFGVVGDVLWYLVEPSAGGQRPAMLNVLAQAMLWFNEGCRESVSIISIAKFSAALKILSCDDKTTGIQRLITARLGIEGQAAIRPGGPTMASVLEQIFVRGQNCSIHGSESALCDDWNGTRTLSEQFASLCLRACLEWASENPHCNNPRQLSS